MRIKLGSEVKDEVTGLKGIAVSRTEYLQGCFRIGVQAKELKDGTPVGPYYVDEPQLITIKEKAVERNIKNDNGGPAYAQPPQKRIG